MPKKAVGYLRKRGEFSYELSYKRHTKTVHAKTERDAERMLAKFIADIDADRFKPASKMTLNQLAARFLRDAPNASAETKKNYEIHLKKRILPALGHKKIDKITPSNLLDFYANLQEDGVRDDGKPGGLSPATIHKHHNILSSLFSFAIQIDELESNPCERIKPPKIPKRKKASLDRDPTRNLLAALAEEKTKYRVIAIIAACTGMRRNEILGLGDSKISFEDHTFTIDRMSKHSTGRTVYLKSPKTETGIRTIPFPPSIDPLLKEMIRQRDEMHTKCGDLWVETIEEYGEPTKNDLLFTAWNGAPMHPNTIDGWFAKFKKKNGLPDRFKFHGLRHTNIMLQLKSGVDVGTAADMVGHASRTMTLAYDDVCDEALRNAAASVEQALTLGNIIPSLISAPEPTRKKH
jgi:integrase